MSQSSRCPVCGTGVIQVYATRANQKLRVRTRYRRCSNCDHRPEKQVLPLEIAPVRSAMCDSWTSRKEQQCQSA
ncbi:hypothetical protein LOC67_23435 [Stieleria sp. JC731]|uniref:hypothetical protein n=1 Tax=Pirellulaceae TaxID=2691357 RepID=UPI001E45D65E|nr:hypothetical protein [Stieleria sp. JC731]MCC9603513.1 hypothetical protein [Stieleria sp. JC731]